MAGKSSSEKEIDNLKVRYVLALSLVGILSICTYLLTLSILDAGGNDSRVINVAGRQRMLSQKITKSALILVQSQFRDQQAAEQLSGALTLFSESHYALVYRDESLGLGGENSKSVLLMFEEIQPDFDALTRNAELIHSSYSDQLGLLPRDSNAMANLIAAETAFLPRMNSIVFQYDTESSVRQDDKIIYETVMVSIVLIVLALEALFIFHPAVRRLREYFERLREANRERQRLAAEIEDQNEELKGALDRAKESTRLKSEFLATMSHEIRTPMNATVGMTTLLLDTELSSQQREFAETIRNSSDALLVIINDILDFSKIESGKLVLEHHAFDLRDAVESALSLFSIQAGQKGLNLVYFMEPDVPEFVEADSGRLRQILVNLIGNSVKFTEKGSVTLRLSLAQSAADSDSQVKLRFEIEDTGIGIPEDKLANLFTPFTQADGSTTRRYGGTGLGLSISRLLAELMGGSIDVKSTPGEGSVFGFAIEASVSSSLVKNPVNKPQDDLADKRVLIVDDNEVNCELLEKVTSTWGMKPIVFERAKSAISAIQGGMPFDIAVLDYHMPDINGIGLAKEIQQIVSGKPPMVMLSSMTHEENAHEDLFIEIFTKPLRPGLILEAFLRVFSVNGGRRAPEPVKPDEINPDFAAEHPIRILVADDNTVNLRVSTLMLKRMGYRPDSVVNGREVITALERQHYDVVLLDVHMPIMDGLEAASIIRSDRPGDQEPWLIALTAAASEEDRNSCLASGMDAYLTKPFKPRAIMNAFLEYEEMRH